MAVNLSPVFGAGAQLFNNDGVPLSGGLIYTYSAGSSTPAAVYTSSLGTIAHSNPIVLDSAGRVPSGEIWLTDGIAYKFVVKDANFVLIGTYDNIVGINSNFVGFTSQEETQTATQSQTVFTLTSMQYQPASNNLIVYVNGSKQIAGLNYTETSSTVITFADGLNVGDIVDFSTASPLASNVTTADNVAYNEGCSGAVTRTVESKLQEIVSVKDFGAVGDGVEDDTVAIQAALTCADGGALYFPAGEYKITDTLKTTSNTRIYGDGQSSVITTDLDIILLSSDETAIYGALIQNIRFDNKFPVSQVAGPIVSGTLTGGSNIVPVNSISGLYNGMSITGTGIPAGTYIRVSNYSTAVFLTSSTGSPVYPTASGGQTLSTFFAEGQTEFHISFNNSMLLSMFNVTFTTSFTDVHYSPNNHAGVSLVRDGSGGGFAANIDGCFFNHAQLELAISDSNVKNTIIWANPFEYTLKIAAPGNTVEGCNLSAGGKAALWATATITDTNGASNHTIVGNNIDGGDVWYTGYGVFLDKPLNTTIVGNRFNNIYKGGLYSTDCVFTVVTGNTFLNTNRNDSLYSDIEISSVAFQCSLNTVTGNTFSQTNAKSFPGYAIKEVNAGGGNPSSNSYSCNSVTTNYASPSFLVLVPTENEQVANVGVTSNGLTSFTPSFVNVTLGNGTVTGYYQRTNNQITVNYRLTVGSTTVFTTSPIGVVLPVACNANFASNGSAIGNHAGGTQQLGGVSTVAAGSIYGYIVPTSGGGNFWNLNVPWTWAATDTIDFTLTYNI